MSTVVVYYSKSNNTRTGAEYLAEMISADMIELSEKRERKGFFGFLKSGFQAVTKKNSALEGDPWIQISGFSDIYLMTPIWAANGTPAMNSFIEKADFAGKKVILITFQADIKKESSEKVHDYYRSKIESRGGELSNAIALHSALPGKFAGKEYIHEQIKEALKPTG